MNYRITIVESPEGFAVWCDDLPGCCSQGGTREEAVANIQEAIAEYLAAQREDVPRIFGSTVTHDVVKVESEFAHA